MERTTEKRICGSALYDLAKVHNGDLMGEVPHGSEVMADQKVGHIERFLQVL
jgi:hypothetical protein